MDGKQGKDRIPKRLTAEACQTVASLIGDSAILRELEALMPTDDEEFEEAMVGRELGLIAAGASPVEIAFRLAVICTAREALCTLAEIAALPAADGHPARTRL